MSEPYRFGVVVCPHGKTDGVSFKKVDGSSVAAVGGRFCRNNCSIYAYGACTKFKREHKGDE